MVSGNMTALLGAAAALLTAITALITALRGSAQLKSHVAGCATATSAPPSPPVK